MVHLRATQRVLRLLPPQVPSADDPPDTALGDWFVNRLVIDRRPLLILVSGTSLLPILEPARAIRSLPERLPEIVRSRLERLGMDKDLIDPEIDAMRDVLVAATNDRSVVGTMVDFANSAPYYVPEGAAWGDDALPHVEAMLSKMPCRASKARETVFPYRRAAAMLGAMWAGGMDQGQ